MRSFLLVVVALLAGVGAALGVLVITGDTSSSSYAAIKQMLSTVRQFPDAQIAFSVYAPGNPLADLSLVVDQSTNDPQVNLDSAGQRANSEIFVFLAKQPVLDLIVAGGNAYARIDFSLLRPIFPTSAEQTAVDSLQAQAGNRWLALPPGLINGFAGAGGPSGITAGEVREYVAAVEQAVRSHAVVSSGVSAGGAHGIVVTGPIGPLVSAALSALDDLPAGIAARLPALSPLAGQAGTYRIGFYSDSDGVLRQVGLGMKRAGSATGVGVVINHNPVTIAPPKGARPFPLSSVEGLLKLGSEVLPAGLL